VQKDERKQKHNDKKKKKKKRRKDGEANGDSSHRGKGNNFVFFPPLLLQSLQSFSQREGERGKLCVIARLLKNSMGL
jgi:hypothetical protein